MDSMSNFEQNIINIYGQRGRDWLENLPMVVKELSDAWGLSHLKPISNLSHNYVMHGLRADTDIILKISLDIKGLRREVMALKAFAGFGAALIIDECDGAILMERAVPGTSLRSTKDSEAIPIACQMIMKLHQAPLPQGSPHIKDWLTALDAKLDIPDIYLEKARRIRDELLEEAPRSVLLHGDLHHDNIIINGDEWMVIDPKGVIGDPAYEVAAFIRNPMPELLELSDASSIINSRMSTFAKMLGIDVTRIRRWCFVQAVLAWAWALEDGVDPTYFKDYAMLIIKGNNRE